MRSDGITIREIAELLGFEVEKTRKYHLTYISKLERGIYSRADAYAHINKIRAKQGKDPIGTESKARITRLRIEELSETTSTFTIQVEGINAEDFIRQINEMLKGA